MLERLKQQLNNLLAYPTSEFYNQGVKASIDVINSYNPWIPVVGNEDLSEDTEYFVLDSNNEVGTAIIRGILLSDGFKLYWDVDESSKVDAYSITHFMLIPTSPNKTT